MKKSELIQMIKEEVMNYVHEFAKPRPIGHPSNLHGSEQSQRQWVINFADRNEGLVSASMIAEELGIPRDQVSHWGYIRRIYYDPNLVEQDFAVAIPGVPFQSSTVFRLLSTPEPTEEQLEKIKSMEEKLFKNTQGVYYPVLIHPKVNPGMHQVGWITLQKGDPIQRYVDMMSDAGKANFYVGKTPMQKGPKEGDTIWDKESWAQKWNSQG